MEEKGILLRESLKKLENIFKFSGLRFHGGEKNYWIMRTIYSWNVICIVCVLVGTISWFVDGIRTGKDLATVTFVAPCICYTFISFAKTVFLVKEENHVEELINKLIEMEGTAKVRNYMSEQKERESADRKFLHILMDVLNIFYVILCLSFAIAPLSLIALNYNKSGKLQLFLPFLVKYPFDPLDIKIWPFVYIVQILSSISALILVCSADYFLYVCCTYIKIQFKLLKRQIERFIPDKLEENQQNLNSKFVEIVKWHQELLRSADILEMLYSKSTLCNFISSSILICLTLFNVTVMSDTAFKLSFLSFLCLCLLQIYFLCYFGDIMTQSSSEVSDAVYNCLWYNKLDASFVKSFPLVQVRAQKPCKLTAYGFADVTLRAFTKILSNAWSYFALLKTIYH